MDSGELMLPLPSLGDYIEFHRKRLGLTREGLGRRAHLSPRTIQKLESGERTGLSAGSLGSLGEGLALLAELQHDADFARLWLERRVAFDRSVDEPQYIYTGSGAVSVTMQLQSLPSRADRLHLCVGVVRPLTDADVAGIRGRG
ncbi:helix-turn-helix transcriptional regulator [Nocardia sp. NPDC051030]|uniref:helix-turn-helix domain-containing protein n=1 Tax=Nocardia sp. NPDC051030 TaxID=3155162 RepID=UPI00342B9805